jgi:hypothetical protein
MYGAQERILVGELATVARWIGWQGRAEARPYIGGETLLS